MPTPLPPGTFEITARAAGSAARCGRLVTAHGEVHTPAFMPVGTQATVKAMRPADLEEAGVEMILCNTYHLAIRPGTRIVRQCGGLHRFMGWHRPILTDSGGYQVFSLAQMRKVSDDGIRFRSHVDGSPFFLDPASAMAIQAELGSDIAMALDECPAYPCSHDSACIAVGRTLRWAALCSRQPRAAGQLAFGIVQGGEFDDLRAACARELARMPFDGYAVGGVSVGEPEHLLLRGMRAGLSELPEARPRYLMGVGRMSQILEAVAQGIDMFDCVMPTRYARNGTAFTRRGRYPVKSARYKADDRPVEDGCGCYACAHFSRAYVRHLLNAGEILGAQLLTIHNTRRYMEFMGEARAAIAAGAFEALREAAAAAGPDGEEHDNVDE